MFGYVRPVRDELKVKEWKYYRAAYCGVCDAMGRRMGLAARMFLNYDFTFLAMLLLPPDPRPELSRCRCPARLWCRKRDCTAVHPGMDLAADESVILTYWKLRDGILDGSFWKRQGARLLVLLLTPAYRRAARARPEYARTVEDCLARLHQLEEENCPSLDRPADAFACLLSAAAPATGNSGQDRAVEQLLYHVGRWIYLVDAWDDLEEDLEQGNYNPLAARFPDGAAAHREDVRITLCHSRNLAASALELLDRGAWRGILENIVYLGLPAVERMVFDGTRKKMKHNRRMDL